MIITAIITMQSININDTSMNRHQTRYSLQIRFKLKITERTNGEKEVEETYKMRNMNLTTLQSHSILSRSLASLAEKSEFLITRDIGINSTCLRTRWYSNLRRIAFNDCFLLSVFLFDSRFDFNSSAKRRNDLPFLFPLISFIQLVHLLINWVWLLVFFFSPFAFNFNQMHQENHVNGRQQ